MCILTWVCKVCACCVCVLPGRPVWKLASHSPWRISLSLLLHQLSLAETRILPHPQPRVHTRAHRGSRRTHLTPEFPPACCLVRLTPPAPVRWALFFLLGQPHTHWQGLLSVGVHYGIEWEPGGWLVREPNGPGDGLLPPWHRQVPSSGGDACESSNHPGALATTQCPT